LRDAEQRKKALVAELEALTGRRQGTASLDVERFDEGRRVGYRFKARGSDAPRLPRRPIHT